MDAMEENMASNIIDISYIESFWHHSWPIEPLNNLIERYKEPHRFYHDLLHIQQMFKDFERCRDRLENKNAFIIGIFYHDAIYDPRSDRNELDSRNLFFDHTTEFFAEEVVCHFDDHAATLIESTIKHVLPCDWHLYWHDIRYFLDVDLGILAANEDDFWEYEANIRKEYSHVPDEAYRHGRVKIMKTFLKRKKIFYTDLFDENIARNNIAGLIKSLV